MRFLTRPVVCSLLALGLGSVAFEMFWDVSRAAFAPQERHAVWVAAHLVLVFALAGAMAASIRDEAHFDLLFSGGGLRRAGPRGWLFAAFSGALEAVLLSCVVSFIAVCFLDGRPPLQWDRIGGVLTDWVVDLALILPLVLTAAFFNGAALAAVLGRRERKPAP